MPERNDANPDYGAIVEDDPTKDAWRTPREDLQGGREPGLIHLNRYPLSLGSHGIAHCGNHGPCAIKQIIVC